MADEWASEWEWTSNDRRDQITSSLISGIVADDTGTFMRICWQPFVAALGAGGLLQFCATLPVNLKDDVRLITSACSRSCAGPALVCALAVHGHSSFLIIDGVIDGAILEGDEMVLHNCFDALQSVSAQYASGMLFSLEKRRELPRIFLRYIYLWDPAQAANLLLPDQNESDADPRIHWLWRTLICEKSIFAEELLAANAAGAQAGCDVALSELVNPACGAENAMWSDLSQSLRLYCVFLLHIPGEKTLIENVAQSTRSVLEAATRLDPDKWPCDIADLMIWCDLLSTTSANCSKSLDLWRSYRRHHQSERGGLAPFDLFAALCRANRGLDGPAGVLIREHLAFRVLKVPLSWIPIQRTDADTALKRLSQNPLDGHVVWSPITAAEEVLTLPPPSCSSPITSNAATIAFAAVEMCLVQGKNDPHDWVLAALEGESTNPGAAGEFGNSNPHPGMAVVVDRYADQCFAEGKSSTIKPLLPFELNRFNGSATPASELALRFVTRFQEAAAKSSLPAAFDYSFLLIPKRKRIASKSIYCDSEIVSQSKRPCFVESWDAVLLNYTTTAGNDAASARLKQAAVSGHPDCWPFVESILRQRSYLEFDADLCSLVGEAWMAIAAFHPLQETIYLATAQALLDTSCLTWGALAREPLLLLALPEYVLRVPSVLMILLKILSVLLYVAKEKTVDAVSVDAAKVHFITAHDNPEGESGFGPHDISPEAAHLLTVVIASRCLLGLCNNGDASLIDIVVEWLCANGSPALTVACRQGLSFDELVTLSSRSSKDKECLTSSVLREQLPGILRHERTEVQLSGVTLAAALATTGVLENGSPEALEITLACATTVASFAITLRLAQSHYYLEVLAVSLGNLDILVGQQPREFQASEGLTSALGLFRASEYWPILPPLLLKSLLPSLVSPSR